MKIKKTLFGLLLAVLLLLTACPIPVNDPEDEVIEDTVTPPASKPWTIIIHLAVDNNIDYSYEADYGIITNYLETLEIIKSNDTDDRMNIIVYMDGCQTYSDYTSPFTDGYYVLSGGNFANDLKRSIVEVNSGSLFETETMFDWVVSNYPGDRWVYSIFNHGSGFDDSNSSGTYGTSTLSDRGIGFDDSDSDSLSHDEVGQALDYLKNKIGKNIDLFFPYACLMGGIELAYQVKDSTDYILFSEEVFPAENWSYEALQAIDDRYNDTANSTELSAEELGKAFCESAEDYFINTTERDFTLALVDLTKVDTLVSALDALADVAITDIDSDENLIGTDYNEASIAALKMDVGYYFDIKSYMNALIARTNISSDVTTQAQAVLNVFESALNPVVQFSSHGNASSGTSYAEGCGISVFNSQWYCRVYPTSIYAGILDFGMDTDWDDFQKLIIDNKDPIPNDDYDLSNDYDHNDEYSMANAKSITMGTDSETVEPQNHTFHEGDLYDAVKVELVEGTNYKFTSADDAARPDNVPSPDLSIVLLNDVNTDLYNSEEWLAFSSEGTPALTYSPATTGTYYLAITENRGYETYYTLSLEEYILEADVYEPDDTSAEAHVIVLDQPQDHSLDLSTDVDWIKFTAQEGEDYEVLVSSEASYSMLDMYLCKESDLDDFNPLNSDTYIAYGWEDSPCQIVNAEAETYYIRITSWNNAVGTYSISLVEGLSYSHSENLRLEPSFLDGINE